MLSWAALLLACGARAAQRPAPVDIVSLEFRPEQAAPGSPPQPYALESGGLFLTVRNPGPGAIPVETMTAGVPELEGPFAVDHPALYFGAGGAWTPSSGAPFAPRRTAVVWYQGHFTQAGDVAVTARTGADRLAQAFHVLKDPGCYSSTAAGDVFTPGWTIGPGACPFLCATRRRRADSCRGDTLIKTACEPANGLPALTTREVACGNGCQAGACLREKPEIAGRLLELIEPAEGRVLKPGEDLPVSFVSRGVAKVTFTLECPGHRWGPYWAMSVPGAEQKARRSAVVKVPTNGEPASGCRLVASSEDSGPAMSSAVEGLTMGSAKRFEVSDVDAPRYDSFPHPHDLAVVIGVERYASLPPALFAERDAAAVRAHLRGLGFPDANVRTLLGPQATRAGIAKVVEEWLPRLAKRDSRVFVYFSGHGSPDAATAQAYLVPWDGDPSYLESTAYSTRRLHAELSSLKAASVLLVLDSCFSGAGGRSVLPRGARPLVTKVDLGLGHTPVVTMTATAADQISGALESQGHGLFTYYLLKGLNEAPGKGRLTAASLYAYLEPRVESESARDNRAQTPQLAGPADGLVVRTR